MEIVLASASPRRARLLTEAGIAFRVEPVDVDERLAPGTSPDIGAVQLAVRKARASKVGDALVLAADTIVDVDGEVVGKPASTEEAKQTLRRLSNREHRVVTGVAVRRGERIATGLAATKVRFRKLAEREISAYVATGEPMDKAGSYAVQGGAAEFVASIDGPLDNVVGLPMDVVRALLAAMNRS